MLHLLSHHLCIQVSDYTLAFTLPHWILFSSCNLGICCI
jgi:hypothetical protein